MRTLSPLQAIRQNCIDCSAGEHKEIRLCPIHDCPLYPFRFGTNPNRKGVGGARRVGRTSRKERV
jgi:hypothetical protein